MSSSEWIDRQMERGLERVFEQIDRYQRDGYCTEEDVTAALTNGWGWEIAEMWREYIGGEA